MKKIVVKDKDGNLIDIGPWDYQEVVDLAGQVTIMNPLPLGAKTGTAEVVTGWDGGLYLADDPRRLGA